MTKKSTDPKEKNNAWNRFMYQFFDRTPYEMWHDGVDPYVVLDLKGEELIEAEDLLIQSMKEDGMWPTRGLAILRSKRAIPALKEKLASNPSEISKIRVAYALEKIEQNGEYIPILIESLLNAPFSGDKTEVAMNLSEFPTEEVRDALYKGMMDEDYLVRNHSGSSLLAIYGIEKEISEFKELFTHLCADKDNSQNPRESHAKALEMMKELLKSRQLEQYPT